MPPRKPRSRKKPEPVPPTRLSERSATFQAQFLEDLAFWVDTDRKLALRLLRIVMETLRDPFSEGIGKPEPLRGDLHGFWSRRIDDTHRLVYRPTKDGVDFVQARFHY